MRISYSQSQISAWLDSGNRLLPGDYTYSIPNAASLWPSYYPGDETSEPGFALPDAAMGAAFVRAIELWDELIAPDLVQVQDNAFSRGQLRIAITTMSEDNSAYAYYPSGRSETRADIWFNEQYGPWDWSDGGFDFYAMLHEAGHVFGLKHSFEGRSAPDELETRRYSVLSYTAPDERYVFFQQESDGFFSYRSSVNPITPMVLDIAAIQSIYGADPTTRAGDTVYRFEEFAPGLQAIYDAGGNDTIDLAHFTLDNVIDLRPGAYSSIGIANAADQIAYWSALFPQHRDFISDQINGRTNLYTFNDNLGIAINTWIENARSGAGDDEITGNDLDNVLDGGAGKDRIVGLAGMDTLIGGAGDDVLHGDAQIFVPSATAPQQSAPMPDVADEAPASTPTVAPAWPVGLTVGAAANPGSASLEAHHHDHDAQPEIARIAAGPLDGWSGFLNILNSRLPEPEPEPEVEPEPQPAFDDGDSTESPSTTTTGAFALDGSSDELFGGAGNDVLHGGLGRDELTGGTGADRFLFDDGDFAGLTGMDADRIFDFSANEGDRIDLSLVDAISGGSDNAFAFIGSDEFSQTAGELRYEALDGYALVSGDQDGDGIGDFAIRLDGVDTLLANNFIL
ncbi:MAG: M10 family metallopeptidase [Sphingomonadaceae bacterium]